MNLKTHLAQKIRIGEEVKICGTPYLVRAFTQFGSKHFRTIKRMRLCDSDSEEQWVCADNRNWTIPAKEIEKFLTPKNTSWMVFNIRLEAVKQPGPREEKDIKRNPYSGMWSPEKL